MGTTRMGTEPNRSVVNEWGHCHVVRDMCIVDGSIFVTGTGVAWYGDMTPLLRGSKSKKEPDPWYDQLRLGPKSAVKRPRLLRGDQRTFRCD